MTLKAAMDDEGVTAETMADRLRAVQTEPWRKLEWVHDEAEAAWEAYNECLLLRSGNPPASGGDDGGDAKGKGLPADGLADDSGAADLADKVPRLRTNWGEDELLRAVSGIKRHDKKPGEEAVTQLGLSSPIARGKGKEKATVPAIKAEQRAEEPSKRPGRLSENSGAPAPTASTFASKRGRPRAASRAGGTGLSDPMQLD